MYAKRPCPNRAKTEEELREENLLSLLQKRVDIAEKVLLNLCNNPSIVSTAFAEPEKIAKASIKVTDAFMQRLFTTEN